jgi:hypothetical protein
MSRRDETTRRMEQRVRRLQMVSEAAQTAATYAPSEEAPATCLVRSILTLSLVEITKVTHGAIKQHGHLSAGYENETQGVDAARRFARR